MSGEMQDEKCCVSSPSFLRHDQLNKYLEFLKYSVFFRISVRQIIQALLWKMKSLSCGLVLAHDWRAWCMNRASWGCLHQLMQTGLRQSLETERHFFRSLRLYSHQPGLQEAQQEGVRLPLARQKLQLTKLWSGWGFGRLPSKSSLSSPLQTPLI